MLNRFELLYGLDNILHGNAHVHSYRDSTHDIFIVVCAEKVCIMHIQKHLVHSLMHIVYIRLGII